MRYYQTLKNKALGIPHDMERSIDASIINLGKTLFGLDTHGRYTREISGYLTELFYASGLGYNPFTAIKNLTQQILSIANFDNPLVGVQRWAEAKRAMMTPYGKTLANTSPQLTSRQPLESLDLEHSVFQMLPGKGGEIARSLKQNSMKMYRASDRSNVTTSHMMKLIDSIERGAPLRQAVEEAYSFSMSTQYMYGIDSPAIFKNPVGRILGTFYSWPLNFWSLLGEQGSSKSKWRAVQTLTGMAYGAEVLSKSGLNFMSIHPMETAKGTMPVSMLTEHGQRPVVMQMGDSIREGVNELRAGKPGARDEAISHFIDAVGNITPFAATGRRVRDNVEAIMNDFKVYDDRERLSYEMAREGPIYRALGIPGEAVRGFIGPTTESRKRWEDLNSIRIHEDSYRRMRRMAVESYMDGDTDEFTKLQQKLMVLYGRAIEPQDLEQEIELRQMDGIERRARGLPESFRKPMLQTLQPNDSWEYNSRFSDIHHTSP